jgi:hypothetical protein
MAGENPVLSCIPYPTTRAIETADPVPAALGEGGS